MKKLLAIMSLLIGISLFAGASLDAADKDKFKPTVPNMDSIRINTQDPRSNYYYKRLWRKFLSNDTNMSMQEYRHLYLGYIFQEDYNPYRQSEFSKKIPLYLGGPVHQEKLFFIHSFENVIIPNSIEIKEGLFFDGDFDTIKSLLLNNPSIINKQIKFFLGYAGWSKGQLNEEIAQNSWLIGQTDNRQIFKSSGDELWKEAVKSVGGPYEKWLHFPKAPYLN